jgi:hypothetical protein
MCIMLHPRLINIMKRELEVQNLQLSPYCVQQLEQVIGQGVKRMQSSKAIDHAGHVMQAERNLKTLVQHFGAWARDEGTFPQLTNAGFDTALAVCPTLWPYRTSG